MPEIVQGDARALDLPDDSVDLIVTSPPYFGLRDYGVDGQIGAEPTPAEFIAALIECTREMVRVLKPNGSIFVNLGDRFSNGDRFDNEFTVEDAAWLAGVIDSDGSISVHKQGTSYTAWIRVGQMRPEVVHRIASVTGVGQVFQDKRGVWNWNAAAQQAVGVLRRIWPWLHIKRQQAFAAVELQERKAAVGGKGRWNALTEDELRRRERIRQAVLAWNRGEVDDYAPPLLPLPDLPMVARRIPQKSLTLLPERYRIAAVDELGLIARAVIVWAKPNGLPSSVTDRVNRTHEDWVHLVKSPRYFAAVDEIREPYDRFRAGGVANGTAKIAAARRSVNVDYGGERPDQDPLGKLPGSVWSIPAQPLCVPPELGIDHFAAFPMEWPRRLILGWSPREVCTVCGEGRRPVVDARPDERIPYITAGIGNRPQHDGPAPARKVLGANGGVLPSKVKTITGYACACPDTSAPSTPGVVLDPFSGTGTTALVAAMHGRRGISVDLNPDYCQLARWRASDPKERARAAGLNPDDISAIRPELPGQESLLDLIDGDAS